MYPLRTHVQKLQELNFLLGGGSGLGKRWGWFWEKTGLVLVKNGGILGECWDGLGTVCNGKKWEFRDKYRKLG